MLDVTIFVPYRFEVMPSSVSAHTQVSE